MKQTTKEKYAEINQNIFNSNLFNRLDTLNDNLKTFNEIMSSLLFIVIKDSTLKTMTANEIKKVINNNTFIPMDDFTVTLMNGEKFPVDIKSHTFFLNKKEIQRLEETIDTTTTVLIRKYELGLYL